MGGACHYPGGGDTGVISLSPEAPRSQSHTPSPSPATPPVSLCVCVSECVCVSGCRPQVVVEGSRSSTFPREGSLSQPEGNTESVVRAAGERERCVNVCVCVCVCVVGGPAG